MVNGHVRSPDVSFMQKSRLADGKPSKGFQDGAPDLCVEIISPSEEPAEMRRNLAEYFIMALLHK
ncbi:MAG: Uma2 family endonuclease [Armatimonadetes bacterium]|nr:Uma2 family endonuclease [Armatimonadota bacterium]